MGTHHNVAASGNPNNNVTLCFDVLVHRNVTARRAEYEHIDSSWLVDGTIDGDRAAVALIKSAKRKVNSNSNMQRKVPQMILSSQQ